MRFESAATFGENKLIRADLAYTPFLSLLFFTSSSSSLLPFSCSCFFCSLHSSIPNKLSKKIQIFPIKELLEKFGNPFPKIEVDKSNLSLFKQKVFLFCSTCIEKHCFCFYYHICITAPAKQRLSYRLPSITKYSPLIKDPLHPFVSRISRVMELFSSPIKFIWEIRYYYKQSNSNSYGKDVMFYEHSIIRANLRH